MLTSDLVPVRRRGATLRLPALDRKLRTTLSEMAEEVLSLLQAMAGATREQVEGALNDAELPPQWERAWRGLCKLALDAATFESTQGDTDPVALRDALAVASAAARRCDNGAGWDRGALIARVAAAHGLSADAVDGLMFADLPASHRLLAPPALDADALVTRWHLACHQAVLLRAVGVEVELSTRDGALLRDVFRGLKFRRLLWQSERLADGRVALRLDGPLALHAQTTRYGLALASALPLWARCERWALRAQVRWQRTGQLLTFAVEGRRGAWGGDEAPPALPDELARLIDALPAHGWTATPCAELREVPGVGTFVADLSLRRGDGAEVWAELLGYWSREAVFRRLDLLKAGLDIPVLLLATERLRVDEQLADGKDAALLVFKGVLPPRRVAEYADALAAQRPRPPGDKDR